MFPRATRAITGATSGVSINLGFKPTFCLLWNTTDGLGAVGNELAAAGTGLALGATGAAAIATSGFTFGSQGLTVGANALPNGKAGVLFIF